MCLKYKIQKKIPDIALVTAIALSVYTALKMVAAHHDDGRLGTAYLQLSEQWGIYYAGRDSLTLEGHGKLKLSEYNVFIPIQTDCLSCAKQLMAWDEVLTPIISGNITVNFILVGDGLEGLRPYLKKWGIHRPILFDPEQEFTAQNPNISLSDHPLILTDPRKRILFIGDVLSSREEKERFLSLIHSEVGA